ncbi:MAG: alkaline phosphatase family protein [Phycisphaerales bacterium]|nr:MAG: alkaline phosphatase family protein [Phycisphaerales bacterium]
MKTKRKRIITCVLFLVLLLATGAMGAWEKYRELTIVRITQPEDNAIVLAGETYTLKCVVANDVDVWCPYQAPPNDYPYQQDDPLTFTWDSTNGLFSGGNTGTEVNWIAPGSETTVEITVAVHDNSSPYYADDVDRTHKINVNVKTTTVRYVHDTAGGSNNGTSWGDAYTDLSYAIGQVSAGTELWVAHGTYYPPPGPYPTWPEYTSIAIDKGVKIYGGFAGTENAREQRDWAANQTTLSGDIGTSGDDSDNSIWVVTCTSGDAVLDGFTVTKGRGTADGAGIWISGCSPTIQNCIFKDNFCDGPDADGGGMECYNHSSPTVINCVFLENVAGDDGGALCNKHDGNGKFINCAFYNNTAQGDDYKGDGGAIFNTAMEDNEDGSSPVFINCVIAGNQTQRDGGGASNNAESQTDNDPVYINCTFRGNTAGDDGGGLSSKDGSDVTLKNCIFWDDVCADNGPELFFNATSSITVSYSDVEGCNGSGPSWNTTCGTDGGGNKDVDPEFVDTTDAAALVGPDGRWLTCDDGLRIKFNSPCIDSGDGDAKDSYTEANVNVADALGIKHIDIRTVTDAGTGTPTYYDMGAFEAAVERTIFISVDGFPGWSVEMLINANELPAFKSLKNNGLWTWQARTDPTTTETSPNHTTMVTGRPVRKKTTPGANWTNYVHHGYTDNGMPPITRTLHKYNPYLSYISSCFCEVHDRSLTTAGYFGKDKLIIYEWSYDSDTGYQEGGRSDPYSPNDGKDKIDTFEWTSDHWNYPGTGGDYNSNVLMSRFIDGSGNPEYYFGFTFLHLKGPDKVGHNQGGWGNPTSGVPDNWLKIAQSVDGHLDTLMDLAKDSTQDEWYYNTMIVVSADHGGVNGGHGTSSDPCNYTIPFGVWGHLIPKGGDMYQWCDKSRAKPGQSVNPAYPDCVGGQFDMSGQPIRHADGVDLCLNFLGVQAIGTSDPTGPGAIIKNMRLKYNP